jgi:hypothetical protein
MVGVPLGEGESPAGRLTKAEKAQRRAATKSPTEANRKRRARRRRQRARRAEEDG